MKTSTALHVPLDLDVAITEIEFDDKNPVVGHPGWVISRDGSAMSPAPVETAP